MYVHEHGLAIHCQRKAREYAAEAMRCIALANKHRDGWFEAQARAAQITAAQYHVAACEWISAAERVLAA